MVLPGISFSQVISILRHSRPTIFTALLAILLHCSGLLLSSATEGRVIQACQVRQLSAIILKSFTAKVKDVNTQVRGSKGRFNCRRSSLREHRVFRHKFAFSLPRFSSYSRKHCD